MKRLIFIIFIFCLFAHNAWAVTKVTIQDSPPQVYANQEFDVVFNVINDFVSSDSYYIKGRIGSASASLNKGETYNPVTNNWFFDTSSWSNFPIINFNNDTIATASVKLRANQTISIENNLLVIRVNKNGNYDSSSAALLVFEPTSTLTPTSTPTPTIAPTIGTENPSPIASPKPTAEAGTTAGPVSYDNIFLSEVMANPVTGEKEWVEIYNDNDFSVSLNNWYIDDLENTGSSPKVFSLEISGKNYGVFNLTSSMFNNDRDSVRLLDFNKNLKDDFEYQEIDQGKTLGRTSFESDDFCLQEPSKNSANNQCIDPTPTLITPTPAEKIILSSTIKNISSVKPIAKASNFDVSIHRSINYPTGIVQNNSGNGDVLGIKDELVINSPDIKSLINLLTILSTSYSLLTIISILFRMKLLYGKNKNFYSPSLHSS